MYAVYAVREGITLKGNLIAKIRYVHVYAAPVATIIVFAHKSVRSIENALPQNKLHDLLLGIPLLLESCVPKS